MPRKEAVLEGDNPQCASENRMEQARNKPTAYSVALPNHTDLFGITKHEYVLSTEYSTILLILATWNTDVVTFNWSRESE